jgi:hypothetical protein
LWDQRNILAHDLSGYLPGPDVDAPVQIKELVSRKALSEHSTNNSITCVDVLRALKTDVHRLFPAPCLIKAPDNFVLRVQTESLVRDIVSAGSNPVIIHAESGVGKSIFALVVKDHLPSGSVAILYDCFGDGQYRSPIGYRIVTEMRSCRSRMNSAANASVTRLSVSRLRTNLTM